LSAEAINGFLAKDYVKNRVAQHLESVKLEGVPEISTATFGAFFSVINGIDGIKSAYTNSLKRTFEYDGSITGTGITKFKQDWGSDTTTYGGTITVDDTVKALLTGLTNGKFFSGTKLDVTADVSGLTKLKTVDLNGVSEITFGTSGKLEKVSAIPNGLTVKYATASTNEKSPVTDEIVALFEGAAESSNKTAFETALGNNTIHVIKNSGEIYDVTKAGLFLHTPALPAGATGTASKVIVSDDLTSDQQKFVEGIKAADQASGSGAVTIKKDTTTVSGTGIVTESPSPVSFDISAPSSAGYYTIVIPKPSSFSSVNNNEWAIIHYTGSVWEVIAKNGQTGYDFDSSDDTITIHTNKFSPYAIVKVTDGAPAPVTPPAPYIPASGGSGSGGSASYVNPTTTTAPAVTTVAPAATTAPEVTSAATIAPALPVPSSAAVTTAPAALGTGTGGDGGNNANGNGTGAGGNGAGANGNAAGNAGGAGGRIPNTGVGGSLLTATCFALVAAVFMRGRK
jgi:hypothetical protein